MWVIFAQVETGLTLRHVHFGFAAIALSDVRSSRRGSDPGAITWSSFSYALLSPTLDLLDMVQVVLDCGRLIRIESSFGQDRSSEGSSTKL